MAENKKSDQQCESEQQSKERLADVVEFIKSWWKRISDRRFFLNQKVQPRILSKDEQERMKSVQEHFCLQLELQSYTEQQLLHQTDVEEMIIRRIAAICRIDLD